MRLLKESFGDAHHEYATAMNNVATLHQALGRYTQVRRVRTQYDCHVGASCSHHGALPASLVSGGASTPRGVQDSGTHTWK